MHQAHKAELEHREEGHAAALQDRDAENKSMSLLYKAEFQRLQQRDEESKTGLEAEKVEAVRRTEKVPSLLIPTERLVFYGRTTSASTAPCTPRRTCCPYAYVLITVLRVSRSVLTPLQFSWRFGRWVLWGWGFGDGSRAGVGKCICEAVPRRARI